MGGRRPDAVTVWQDPDVRRRLRWYRAVMEDRAPAKFRLCRAVAVEGDFAVMDEAELWRLHDDACRVFARRLAEVREDGQRPADVEDEPRNLLQLKAHLARRMMGHCNLCEWDCGIDRTAGKWGVCGVREEARVGSAFPHFGEEAPLIGPNQGGSGTIFFSGCVMHCVFCQNWETSVVAASGTPVTAEELAGLVEGLRAKGCANVNFVGGDPIPNIPAILAALGRVRVNVPAIWNSDMYATAEAMKLLREVVDLWLPDFKFWDDECARRLARVRNYRAVVARNHLLARGAGDMIVRHLVMPDHLECCTKPILRWVGAHLPEALVNVMDQYRPAYLVARQPDRFPEVARRPTYAEIGEAHAVARDLGLAWQAVSR